MAVNVLRFFKVVYFSPSYAKNNAPSASSLLHRLTNQILAHIYFTHHARYIHTSFILSLSLLTWTALGQDPSLKLL